MSNLRLRLEEVKSYQHLSGVFHEPSCVTGGAINPNRKTSIAPRSSPGRLYVRTILETALRPLTEASSG